MSTRGELKDRAKAGLRGYYWAAFLACIVTAILGGGSIRLGSKGLQVGMGRSGNGGVYGAGRSGVPAELDPGQVSLLLPVLGVLSVIFVIMWAISILWGTFVGNVVRVGSCKYFVESQEQGRSAGLGLLFSRFERGSYGNVVLVMFMKGLLEFLWTLLLIIPGIIKSYQYYLVPYLLAENPRLDYREALGISKDMMDGHKWRLFVLELSFLGWDILGFLLCGLGGLFVAPYKNATYGEFYLDLCRSAGNSTAGPEPWADGQDFYRK